MSNSAHHTSALMQTSWSCSLVGVTHNNPHQSPVLVNMLASMCRRLVHSVSHPIQLPCMPSATHPRPLSSPHTCLCLAVPVPVLLLILCSGRCPLLSYWAHSPIIHSSGGSTVWLGRISLQCQHLSADATAKPNRFSPTLISACTVGTVIPACFSLI